MAAPVAMTPNRIKRKIRSRTLERRTFIEPSNRAIIQTIVLHKSPAKFYKVDLS
jgi:hypothetical protein